MVPSHRLAVLELNIVFALVRPEVRAVQKPPGAVKGIEENDPSLGVLLVIWMDARKSRETAIVRLGVERGYEGWLA